MFGIVGEAIQGLIQHIIDVFSGKFNKDQTIEELTAQGWTYGGAGGADIVEGLSGVGSFQELIDYFTSGQFHDDAMKEAPSTESAFDKILNLLQKLGLFSPYGAEDALSSGGGSGGVLKSPPQAPNAGLGEALSGLLDAIKNGTVSDYFTSGQFHDDMMQGTLSPEESFGKIIEWLQGLEIFSPYGAGEDGGLIDQFRQLFQEATATTLNLEIQSNTVLTLDGQTVATSVKSYLAEDLINQEVASGDVARTVVI